MFHVFHKPLYLLAAVIAGLVVVSCGGGGGSSQSVSSAQTPSSPQTPSPDCSACVVGIVQTMAGTAISNARVTLFDEAITTFFEVRSNSMGEFSIPDVSDGNYRLGVAAIGYDYEEQQLSLSESASRTFNLNLETEPGRWSIVGDTTPELLDGTGSGSLLPTARFLVCHNTVDPVIYDFLSDSTTLPSSSGSAAGCHVTTVDSNGRVWFIGGSVGGNPQDTGVTSAKSFLEPSNSWQNFGALNTARWYPGLVRLPNEQLLIIGGHNAAIAGRTDTCEIYDPSTNTWSYTGSMGDAVEMPPAVLLLDGTILKTWRFPQLFSLNTQEWTDTSPHPQVHLGAVGGGHSDHSLVYLRDGRVMTLGLNPETTNSDPRFVQFYDPELGSWQLGPNPTHLRQRPEALLLPDSRVLAFGGEYTGNDPSTLSLETAGGVIDVTRVADLFDPRSDTWRPLALMNRFIHYHNVSVLLPDGRVLATAGAGAGGLFGDDSSIEAYEPPYLFRGVRPQINSISSTSIPVGGSFTFDISRTSNLTEVVVIGGRAVTHWKR